MFDCLVTSVFTMYTDSNGRPQLTQVPNPTITPTDPSLTGPDGFVVTLMMSPNPPIPYWTTARIVGIAVGVPVGLLLLGLLIFFIYLYRHRRSGPVNDFFGSSTQARNGVVDVTDEKSDHTSQSGLSGMPPHSNHLAAVHGHGSASHAMANHSMASSMSSANMSSL